MISNQSEYRAHGIKLTWLSANLLANPRFPYTAHRAETLCDILLAPPETPYHKSQPLFQKYKSILPTSLTYIVLIGQRLLTLETCCGFWYGYDQESQMTHSISILFTHRSIVQTQMRLPFQLLYFPISVLHNSREVTSPQLQPKLEVGGSRGWRRHRQRHQPPVDRDVPVSRSTGPTGEPYEMTPATDP
jgi:hypothetical protein